ncbi:hypothetical protein ACJWDR_37425 [Streptomyces tauricus]|uniref:hypothetical protein n=1 Tax=Streptomyces tauricus TaxID=68274 RepID=UPI00387EFBE0
MNENSHLPPSEDNLRALGRIGLVYCTWHQGYTTTGKLVQAVDRTSGSGGVLFACLSCRRDHHLTPVSGDAS